MVSFLDKLKLIQEARADVIRGNVKRAMDILIKRLKYSRAKARSAIDKWTKGLPKRDIDAIYREAAEWSARESAEAWAGAKPAPKPEEKEPKEKRKAEEELGIKKPAEAVPPAPPPPPPELPKEPEKPAAKAEAPKEEAKLKEKPKKELITVEEIDDILRTLEQGFAEIDRELKILTDEDLFYKTKAGAELKSLEGFRDWIEKAAIIKIFEEFIHSEKKIYRWLGKNIEEKEIAEQLKKIFDPFEKRKEEWFQAAGRKDWKGFIASVSDRQKNNVRLAILGLLDKRIEQTKKTKEKTEEELEKTEEKAKSILQDMYIEGERLLDQEAQMTAIEKEVLDRADYNSQLIEYVFRISKEIEEGEAARKYSAEEVAKALEKAADALARIRHNNEKSLELVKEGRIKAIALSQTGAKKGKKIVSGVKDVAGRIRKSLLQTPEETGAA
jgi:hypothetical protein